MSEIKPGIIICNANQQSYSTDIVPWGIVLPKEQFLKYFEKEKGKWPNGKVYSDTLKEFYGDALPIRIGNAGTMCGKKAVLVDSPDKFNSEDNYVGVKWFGELHSNTLGRSLGFEVVDLNSSTGLKFFENITLDSILETRKLIESCNVKERIPASYERVDSDLRITLNYFNGKYPTETLKGMYRYNRDSVRLVEMLADCFPK